MERVAGLDLRNTSIVGRFCIPRNASWAIPPLQDSRRNVPLESNNCLLPHSPLSLLSQDVHR